MLPYQKDGLNSRKMALAFMDGSMVQFMIPEPSYAIDLNLRGFKKILQENKPAEALWIYGAFLDVRIYIPPEPEFKKTFFDASLVNGVSKIVPSSQKNVDEFLVLSEALKGAFLKAIEKIQKDKNTQNIIKLCEL